MSKAQKNTLPESVLTMNQKKVLGWKLYEEDGERYRIKATIRYDDECKNGHNSFSITGETERLSKNGRWMEDSGGCIHDKIEKHFPEIAPLIKWHLVSSDGPMHYIANTLHFAGNRDCLGKLKGEVKDTELYILFNDVPIRHHMKQKFTKWIAEQSPESLKEQSLVPVEHEKNGGYDFKPKHTLSGYPVSKWHECPLDERKEAEEFLQALQQCTIKIIEEPSAWSEGKERQLDYARSSAVWPDATDAELCAEPEELKAKLIKRLPALMLEFKRDVESLGFVY
jgi:hypothetical protein